MSDSAYSFTPVRRRETKSQDDYSQVDSRPWTAARCNRLLRSLTSRVELLRKDAARFMPSAHQQGPVTETNSTCSTGGESGPLDAAATTRKDKPLNSRKRVRITYSGKCRVNAPKEDDFHGKLEHKNSKRGLPMCRAEGEVSVATPLLVRRQPDPVKSATTCSQDHDEENSPVVGMQRQRLAGRAKNNRSLFQSKESLRRLQTALSPERYALSQGVYHALEALLKATAEVTMQTSSRPGSLFAMCLRNMHSRIELEEDWNQAKTEEAGRKSAIEQPDVSGEVYAELEAIGCSRRGWKHLRTVVRAHGVRIVSEAIETRLLCQQAGSALVMLCVHSDSLLEAETLLWSLLLTIPDAEPATARSRFIDVSAMLPLLTLEDFIKYTGCSTIYFRLLARLFSSRKLKITWLATREFDAFWARVFRALSSQSASKEAAECLEIVLLLMSSERSVAHERENVGFRSDISTAIRTTFSSVLATLTAVVVLDENASSSGDKYHEPTPRGKSVLDILKSVLIGGATLLASRGSYHLQLMFLAGLLTGPTDNVCGDLDLRSIKLPQQEGLQAEASELLCSVARCCGRGVSSNGFEYMKRFGAHIEACCSHPLSQDMLILRNAVVDAAYLFAQKLPDSAHLAYAEEISGRFQMGHVLPQQVSPRVQGAVGFRWEEGISEWVAPTPTPVTLSKRVEARASAPVSHDCEVESPLGSYGRGGKTQVSLPTREQKTCLNPPRRVTDLIPSTPDDERGKAAMRDDEAVFSMSPCASTMHAANFTGKQNKRVRKVDRMGTALLHSEHEWTPFSDAADTTDEEEDELSSSFFVGDGGEANGKTDKETRRRGILVGLADGKLNGRHGVGGSGEKRRRSLDMMGSGSDDELSF